MAMMECEVMQVHEDERVTVTRLDSEADEQHGAGAYIPDNEESNLQYLWDKFGFDSGTADLMWPVARMPERQRVHEALRPLIGRYEIDMNNMIPEWWQSFRKKFNSQCWGAIHDRFRSSHYDWVRQFENEEWYHAHHDRPPHAMPPDIYIKWDAYRTSMAEQAEPFYQLLSQTCDSLTAITADQFKRGVMQVDKNEQRIIKYLQKVWRKCTGTECADTTGTWLNFYNVKRTDVRQGLRMVVTKGVVPQLGMSSLAPKREDECCRVWSSCQNLANNHEEEYGKQCWSNLLDPCSLVMYVTDGEVTNFDGTRPIKHEQMLARMVIRLVEPKNSRDRERGYGLGILFDRWYPHPGFANVCVPMLIQLAKDNGLQVYGAEFYNSAQDNDELRLKLGDEVGNVISPTPLTALDESGQSYSCTGCWDRGLHNPCDDCDDGGHQPGDDCPDENGSDIPGFSCNRDCESCPHGQDACEECDHNEEFHYCTNCSYFDAEDCADRDCEDCEYAPCHRENNEEYAPYMDNFKLTSYNCSHGQYRIGAYVYECTGIRNGEQ